MDIQKTTLNMDCYVGTYYAQTRIESALPLPQGKSAKKVLSTRADVNVQTAVCLAGGVDVAGAIALALVVEGDDGGLFAFEAVADYTHRIADAALENGMQAHVTAQLFSCRCTADEGGLRLVASITLTAVVMRNEVVEAIASLVGDKNLQQKQTELTFSKRVLLGAKSIKLREEAQIPTSSNLLFARGAAELTETAPTKDGTAVSGTLALELLLICDDGGIKKQVLIFPFNDIVQSELSAERHSTVSVTQLVVRSVDSAEGLLEIDATLSVSIYGILKTATTLLCDAYDLDGSFAIETHSHRFIQFCCTHQRSFNQNEQLVVPNHLPEVYMPLYGTAQAAITAVHRDEYGLSVDGVLQLTAVYQCDGGLIHSFTEELPLSFELDCNCDIIVPCITVGNVRLSGSGRLMEAQVALLLNAECYKECFVNVVDDLRHTSSDDVGSGIILYYVDRGETLFDIGKRFLVPISAIMDFNPDVKEPLCDGDRIVLIR